MSKSWWATAVAALAVGTVLALGACASSGATGMSYSEVRSLTPELAPGKGRIYVYRQRALFGNLITPDVTVNGAVVGDSEPGGFFFIDRPAGDYQATAGKPEDRKAEFSLAAGESVYVKISVGGGVVTSHVNADLVGPDAAVAEIYGLSFGKPKYF